MTFTDAPQPARHVLVLEDNFIIAMEAEDILLSLGVEKVRIATSLVQAGMIVGSGQIDFALLDVNLGTETSFDFADDLMRVAFRLDSAAATEKARRFPSISGISPVSPSLSMR